MLNAIIPFSPILVLLLCLLIFKMPAKKAGFITLAWAVIIAFISYGFHFTGLAISIGKGLALTMYIILIIWSAVYLYNLVNEAGAIEVINKNIVSFINEPFIQFLLLSWLFSSFLQGIAGFGVPVVIVAPILVNLGFNPVISAVAVLIGHSWSISFGSMGSSFFAINLVTDIPSKDIATWMGIFDIIAMIFTGIGVSYVYGGLKYVKKGLSYILPTTLFMGVILFGIIQIELMSLIGLITALSGTIFMFLIYKLRSRVSFPSSLYEKTLNLKEAVLPYAMIIVISLLLQVIPTPDLTIAFDFPGFVTNKGYIVSAETGYAGINLLSHPAPIILFSALLGILIYKKKGIWNKTLSNSIAKNTIKKCTSTTFTLLFLITMSVIMMDSGMTDDLAKTVGSAAGRFYPIFAPFVGVLGSFITGSNTNSNVIFGSFQQSAANALGLSAAAMAGAQSIGASVGCSLGPTQVLLGTSAVKLIGQESLVYKKTLGITLATALAIGIANYILSLI